MTKRLLFFVVIFIKIANAQEVTTPLKFNAALKNQANKTTALQFGKSVDDTVQLPFFDDFSYEAIYPSAKLWTDSLVYVNNSFAKNAISKGVATFDGFDKFGDPYSITGNAFGFCDSLTSRPIDLNFPASDSIYLSFYIQPQGFGRAPAIKDSLVLEFLNLSTGNWVQVKRFSGSISKDFKLIMLPITSADYLQKGFKFRFKNKGSQFGGDDHWNLDYLKLERFVSFNDTVTFDVSITGTATSLLTSYSAVPYNQYAPSLLADNHFVSIRNNFRETKSTSFTYKSYIKGTSQKIDSATRGFDLLPYITADNISSNKINIPVRTAPFVLKTTYFCGTGGDFVKANDTVSNYQVFSDYFAYDDGSAENGYGITPSSDGRFAYKFNAINSDTLRAVSIFFTQKEIDNSNNLFTLTIWKSINPEVILYQKTSLSPTREIGINDFVNYELDSAIVVQGDFYVGWIQSTNFLMNVGLDRNYKNNDKMFYKVTSEGWKQSIIEGSVMIRPLFYDEILGTGMNNVLKEKEFIKLSPNPGNGMVQISTLNDWNLKTLNVTVYDIFGRKIPSNFENGILEITSSEAGIYIIQITDPLTGKTQNSRYIKN